MNSPSRQARPAAATALWRNHRKDARSSLDRLRRTPWSSAMTLFVIGVALLLPALLMLVNANFVAVLDEFRQSARLTLFLDDGVSESRALEISEDLLTRTTIESVEYISRSAALAEFGTASGFTELLAGLPTNPLPASLLVTPQALDAAAIEALAGELDGLPEVALVQVDQQWIQRLSGIARLLTAVARTLAIIVMLGLGFIIGNTIKLGVENRKDEIRVIKLVGGTDAFIARPLLYSGLFYGAGGGLLAVLLLWLIGLSVRDPLQVLTGLAADGNFQGLGWSGAVALVLVGGAVGWIAARLASWRYIRAIDP